MDIIDDPLFAHWQNVPPTAGRQLVEDQVDLWEATNEPNHLQLQAEADELLDLNFRRLKKKGWLVPPHSRFLFNLHHVQDYFFLRPLLDLFEPSQLIILSRNGTFYPQLQMEAARAAVLRLGFRLICYDRCDDLPWRSFEGAHLFSASEGTIWYNQSLAHQIVAAARLSGCRTTLLQHGITLETFRNRFYCFGSDTLLTWGDEPLRSLRTERHDVLGRDMPWGAVQSDAFRPMGSPKFADTLLPGGERVIQDHLGVEAGKFDDIVLVGAKSRRGYDRDTSGFLDRLQTSLRCRPERLFIVKTHPSNNATVFTGLSANNLLVLDEAHCIGADISLARVIKGVNIVASSLSTLLLDGAVAGKEILLYETKQTLGYRFVEAAPFEGLSERVVPGLLAKRERESFRHHYANATDAEFYGRFSAFCSEPFEPPNFPADAALSISLASDLEFLWAELEKEKAVLARRELDFEAVWTDLSARIQSMEVERIAFAEHEQRLRDQAEAYRKESIRVLAEWEKAVAEGNRLREQLAGLKNGTLFPSNM